MTITPEQLQAMRCDATDGLNTGGQGVELLATHVMALATEVERLQALLAPTRGDLLVAYASAGAARVEAEQAFARARAAAARSTNGRQAEVYYDADQRLRAAVEHEAAKRAALDAYERANGLDLTHPGEEPAKP